MAGRSWADIQTEMERARVAHADLYRRKGYSVAVHSGGSFSYDIMARSAETSLAVIVMANSRAYLDTLLQTGRLKLDPTPFRMQQVIILALDEVKEILDAAGHSIDLARQVAARMRTWTWSGSKWVVGALTAAAIPLLLAALGIG